MSKIIPSPQWLDKGTYKEPLDGDNIRVPRLEVDDATTFIDKDASNNMTFEDAVTGSKTLAELATGGGGLYGINVETLGANKTLTPNTDKIYQYLDEGDLDRIITLDTASATLGDRFVIRHNGAYNDTHYLEIKQATTSLDKIYAGAIKEFIFDGTNWISRGIGTGENDNKKYSVVIGCNARGAYFGVAIGYNSNAYSEGVAIGYEAWGHICGVAVGRNAKGYNYGVAVGCNTRTNEKYYSIALGYYSKCERTAETSINIDGNTAQKYNAVQGRWSRSIAGGLGQPRYSAVV